MNSHDDVGWLKTVDQYYLGEKDIIQMANVQHIIESVIKELALDPKKRYIQVETAFFWRYWVQQDDEMKAMIKKLVNEGRLEFIGGGWSMHDEATVHYSSLIDNMAFGMKQLNDWFGKIHLYYQVAKMQQMMRCIYLSNTNSRIWMHCTVFLFLEQTQFFQFIYSL